MSAQPTPRFLREALAQVFSLDELKLLCSDLAVNWEVIPNSGGGIDAWALEIVVYFQRRGQLPRMRTACQQRRLERNDIDWINLLEEPLDVGPTSAPTGTATSTTNTGGGASAGRDVSAGKDFVGRDQINITGLPHEEVTRLLEAARLEKEDALKSLQDALKGNQAVREVVIAARATWLAAYSQVDRIGYAKGVHDLLQRIALAYNMLHPTLYDQNVLRPQTSWN